MWWILFVALDAVTLSFFGRKHSLLSDVKEFCTIIIFIYKLALPVLLSKAADAITILNLEKWDSRSDQVAPRVEVFTHPAMHWRSIS